MEIKDILAALKTELLTEEQQAEIQQKLQDLVDLQVAAKLNETLDKEKEDLIAVYEQKFEDYKLDITSKFSDFVDTILEQELEIPEEITEFARKGELYGDLIEEFKVRIGIDEGVMSEESRNLLKEARDEIVSLREEMNEAINESMTAKSDAKTFAAELYKRSKCDGLTEAQRNNVMRLLEGIEKTEDIDRKFEIIVKHYLNEKESEEDDTTCVCPDCGEKTVSSTTNECADCGAKLKNKITEGQAEVKTDKVITDTGSPFDDYKQNVLKILKECKF